MNFFKKIITFPEDSDILEYQVYWNSNLGNGGRFELEYKTESCFFFKTVNSYFGWSSNISESGNSFKTREEAKSFARQHPTYGDIVKFEQDSYNKAKEDQRKTNEMFSTEKIENDR